MVLAFQRWKEIQNIEICLESHGRDLENESLDVSRTVGWFTSMKHLRFPLLKGYQTRVDELVREVNDRRRFALHRTDLADQLPSWDSHAPIITFNYYGAYSDHGSDYFDSVDLSDAMVDEDPTNVRFALLDVGCSIDNGRLRMSIIYSAVIHKEDHVQQLLHLWCTCLGETLEFLKSYNVTNRPLQWQFPSLLLPQDQINALIHDLEPFDIDQSMIEDLVPATDMQKSMVLASLEFGSYLESFTYRIEGDFQVNQFIDAWSQVISKHAALRSLFIRSESQEFPAGGEILQVILSPDCKPSIFTHGEIPRRLKFNFGDMTTQMHLYKNSDGSYFLNWDFHHALIDGWSVAIIMRDFESAYLAQPSARVVSFESVRTRLRELAENQEILDFWKEELGAVLPSRLVDHSLPAASLEFPAPKDWRHDQPLPCSVERIQACAAADSVTVSTLLRAAWAMALSYFIGRDEVVFGVTTSGRNLDVLGIEEVVGPCINTVPFRIHVDQQCSKKSFLESVHFKSSLLIPNDALSLHQIYKASGANDLFDTILVYQNHVRSRPNSNLAFTMKLLKVVEKTDIPLGMVISQDSGHLHAAALVHGSHISLDFVKNLLAAFGLALTWLCDSDEKAAKLLDANLLSSEGQQHVNKLGCGPPLDYPISTAWELVAQQAHRTPENPALEVYQQHAQTISYGELVRRAENGAQYLHEKGLRYGDKAALFLDKSPGLVFTILALFKLGAICVPLRYNDPDSRVRRLLGGLNPRLLILSRRDEARFSDAGQLCHVEDIANWQPEADHPMAVEVPTTDDPAMIMFTSGTTGLPKGVVMPSRQIVCFAVAMAQAYRYDESSRVFSFASYTFDVFITDVFGTLSVGAVVCMAPDESTVDDVSRLLHVAKSTHVNLTPSVASTLDLHKLRHLQSLILTGEPASRTLFQKFAPRIHVVNSYGPTEAGVITWANAGPEADPRCVGHVVPGMRVTVLDDSRRQLPVGVQGTVYTSGTQLCLGYLDGPESTRELFVPSPYDPAELMYNTGDLGAIDSSGQLLCFGRKDEQVKIRGQRVELGEIEDALGFEHRVVAAKVTHPDLNQDRIVAFFECDVTPKDELESTQSIHGTIASNLDALARRTLPSHMVPSTFVPVQQLPLTVNGKVNRKCLQEVFMKYLELRCLQPKVLPKPMSETESRVAETTAKLLGIPSISVDDLFSSLLDSLSSMSLAAKLRTVFGHVGVQWVLDSNNVRDLASKIDFYPGISKEPAIENGLLIPRTMQFTAAADRNVFCIHPASGISFVFRKLAAFLPEVNTIGVNDPCFGDTNAYKSIHEMAARYVESIFSHQQSGHFTLIGYSFGAHVATEVARQLYNSRHKVQLILIDSCVERDALARFASPEMGDDVFNSFKPNVDMSVHAEEGKEFLCKLEREVCRNLRLMSQYQMEPFPWPATLLRARENISLNMSRDMDDSNGYQGLVEGLTLGYIVGGHYEVLEDGYLLHNSSIIRAVLEEAELNR